MKRSEGGKLHVEKVRSAPESIVAQTQIKKRDTCKEKKRMIAASKQECEDTKDLVQWRSISQEKAGFERSCAEVSEKYNMDEAIKGAY